MVKYVNGDLLELAKNGNFDVIAHGANCFCTMKSGIAPKIKEIFPEAYEVDCNTKKGDRAKLGTISYTKNTTPVVVNLYTQFGFWGRKSGKMDLDYEALKNSLTEMKNAFSGRRIGIPKVGCGLGGGNWDVVKYIVEEIFHDEDLTVVIK